MLDHDFRIYAPVSFFEKADAAPGEQMRIGGVVSDEVEDKQEETVLQPGLDFNPFVKSGWFNDNHSKRTTDVLGVPDKDVLKFKKGQRLPDGSVAQANCSWAEGFLLPTPEGRRVFELGKALAKSGAPRRLGYSIEGKIKQRGGPNGKTIVKAEVHNIAITNCPVGQNTRMETLAKALTQLSSGVEDQEVLKALSMGTDSGPPSAMGPTAGEGAGRILTPQHLEEDPKTKEEKEKAFKEAPITKSVATALIQNRMQCSRQTAERALGLLQKAAEAAGSTTMTDVKQGAPLTGEAFEKALGRLEEVLKTPVQTRAEELFRKSQEGTLTTEEQAELVKSVSRRGLGDAATETLRKSEAVREAAETDVTGYLKAVHDGLLTGLNEVATAVEKSQGNTGRFNVALAQGLLEMGAVVKSQTALIQAQTAIIKSLEAKVDAFGNQPAREPKSRPAQGAGLEKSFRDGAQLPPAQGQGGPGQGMNLNKSQIEDALSDMLQKGLDEEAGEPLLNASTKYEMSGLISPTLLAAVERHISKSTNKAA